MFWHKQSLKPVKTMAIKNRRLIVFNNSTLDGYFTSINGDSSWAHKNNEDAEWNQFVADNANGAAILLVGRITYELMANYWLSEQAMNNNFALAERMKNMPKMVFSKTLDAVFWNNTKLVKGNLATEVRKIKKEGGDDMVILGSGSLVAQLAQVGLIDEFRVVINPAMLGNGRTMFDGIKEKLSLELIKTKAFANGNVLLCYKPA